MAVEPGDAVLAMVLRLVESLRAAGVDVAMVELLDATEALRHLGLGNRALLEAALRSTLVKRLEDEPVFDVLFERCFPTTRAGNGSVPAGGRGEGAAGAGLPGQATGPGAWREPGRRQRAGPNRASSSAPPRPPSGQQRTALHALAAAAIDAYAGTDVASGSERYFLFRVLRALDLAALVSAAARADRANT